MSRSLDLAVIAGDGIGPEVVAEALKVLRAALGSGSSSGSRSGSGSGSGAGSAASHADPVEVRTTEYPFGAGHFLETGTILEDGDLEALRGHDAILLGAVGGDPRDPRLAGGIVERGLLLRLRFAFDHFVNLRPGILMPGVVSPLANPGAIDFVVVREGTEGPYTGNGGALRRGSPHEVATEVSVNTAHGVERVVRFAFETAAARERKKLTLVHKTNVLTFAGSLWQSTVDRVAAEFPGVEVGYQHVDAATIHLVTRPEQFDVIVTDNLFGDILTDLAAAVTGGIGLAASANLNPSGDFPSMFEPVHGSAPDIAGTGVADPTAAILSAGLLLEQSGFVDAAARVRDAVAADLGSRGGVQRSTAEVGDAIAARVVGAE